MITLFSANALLLLSHKNLGGLPVHVTVRGKVDEVKNDPLRQADIRIDRLSDRRTE